MLQFSIGEAKVRQFILAGMKRKVARICLTFGLAWRQKFYGVVMCWVIGWR